MRAVYVAAFILLSSTLHAAEAVKPEAETKHWSGEAELGILMTRGNTSTTTVNAKAGIAYQENEWTHALRYEALRTEDNGTDTADRDMLLYRVRYQLEKANYLFGSIRYESDPFAGYDRRTTEVVGIGHQIINEKDLKWDAEVGAGARQTELTDNTETDEAIARLATKAVWNMTVTSTLGQEVLVEHGSENTYTEATTDLKVKINSALAMKMTFKVKDNSDVPVGRKNTDTETAVTLVYDFFK